MKNTSQLLLFALIIIQVFKILAYGKGEKDHGGFDERQELVRGRAFKYGFLTMFFLQCFLILWKETIDNIPIEFGLLMMTCLMIGCLVTLIYCIYKDAYWELRQKSLPFIGMWLFIMVIAIYGIKNNELVVNGVLTWDGGIYVLVGLLFLIILINVLIKMFIDKKDNN